MCTAQSLSHNATKYYTLFTRSNMYNAFFKICDFFQNIDLMILSLANYRNKLARTVRHTHARASGSKLR